jgi:hypothetical protein
VVVFEREDIMEQRREVVLEKENIREQKVEAAVLFREDIKEQR